MNDSIRTISIIVLSGLAFFCLQSGVFLLSGHKYKNNSRRTLVLLQFITALLLGCDALAYVFRGSLTGAGFYIVRISNFLVFALNYFTTFFFCFYSAEFIKSDSVKDLLKSLFPIKQGANTPSAAFFTDRFLLSRFSLI